MDNSITLSRPIDWRTIALLAIAIPSVVWSLALAAATLTGRESFDWYTFAEAARRAGTDALYEPGALTDRGDYAYRYSPLFAWLMVPVTWAGVWIWRVAHLAALAALPWRVALVTLLAWPLWEDVWHGNVLTFTAVLGFLALRGNRWAAAGFLVMALLVPRPLVIPALAWLAWRSPDWRWPGVAIAAIVGALTLSTGQAGPFLAAMLSSTDGLDYTLNLSPSRFVGLWWMVIGVPLAAWLTAHGRVGWAGLALSPYVLPYYLLVLLWEIRPARS